MMFRAIRSRQASSFFRLPLVAAVAIVVLVTPLLAACQPAAPSPTAAPAKPTEAPKPAAPAAPAASPAAAPAAAPASPAAAAVPKATGPAPDSIKIGAVVPLTGRYAALGDQVKGGYELGVEDINKAGGVMVKEFDKKIPLELRLLDDASDPTQTQQRHETLSTSDQVLALLGGAGSDLHAAASSVAEKNKVPYLGIAFALYQVHQKGYKYLFSPFPKSPGIAKSTFDIMDGLNPKPTKVAILAEQTDWGGELRELWTKEAKARGYELVADEQYAPGTKDFTTSITKMKAANADAVLSLPSPPDGLAIAKQFKELDFNAKFYYMIRAPDGPTWSGNLGKDGDYFVLAPGWSPDLKFPGVPELNQAYQAKYNKPADALVGPAYSVIQILANSIERAGRLDRDALRDAIAATDMTTVQGPIKFNPDGTGQVVVEANQWQNGKTVSIWPKDLAGGQILYPAKPWKER